MSELRQAVPAVLIQTDSLPEVAFAHSPCLALPGKRVALMLRPNDGAPIDFARVHERDFAGVHRGSDFIVGE